MCKADFKASNGLFRGRSPRSRLGPTYPAAHKHTGGRGADGGCADGRKQPWKLCLRLDSLCNIFLCQVAYYANTLFTVGVTVSRHESQQGPRAAARYQERWRRWKRTRCQRNVAQNSLSLSGTFYTCVVIKAHSSKKVGFSSYFFTCEVTWEDPAAGWSVQRAAEGKPAGFQFE